MSHTDDRLSRRALIKGGGLGLGAFAAAPAPAPSPSVARAAAPPVAQAERPIWSANYWAKKGDVSLSLFRKRMGAPATGEPRRPGTYLDMTANLPLVDPARVQAPVLLVRGEHDGIATEDDLLEFYRRLPNADRQFVVLAGASHAVALGYTRNQLWHVIRAFLEMPGRAIPS
jgi:pimeloyl-ACP methyl ester carboxylesterase